VQRALQFAALPTSTLLVQAIPSSQLVGQLPGGSQVSPGSTAPLPQLTEQSVSFRDVHPDGQQPSPPPQAVIAGYVHRAVQSAALPTSTSLVQTFPSSQLVGQLPGGSQVSPGSTTPLSQRGAQSLSLFALHPAGQQPSPPVQVTTGRWLQVALQVVALPPRVSRVQAFPSLQLVGQDAGGSQVSPGSTTPLPHTAGQSPSLAAVQPAAQQPSPPAHTATGVWVQPAVQAEA
jgi:hypothetical protein